MDRKKLMPIFMIIFTNILGAGMIQPILPLYVEEQFGATVTQATLLYTAYFGAMFIAAPWLGRLSDKYGRRPILMISQAGTVLSFVMFLFASQMGGWLDGFGLSLGMTGGLVIFFLARLLDGITGGNITIAQAVVSDISTPEERTESLGFLSAAFGMGFIFGPGVGGLLSGINPLAPFIGALVFTIATLVLTYFSLAESLPAEARGKAKTQRAPLSEVISNKTFLLLPLIAFIIQVAFAAVPATLALYADRVLFPDVSEARIVARNVGFMLMVMGSTMVVTQLFLIRPLVKRFGDRALVLGGAAIICFFMLLMPITTTPVVAVLLMMPWMFARGISDPTLQSLVTRFSKPQNRGQLLGLYQAAASLGLIIGPIWSGAVFQEVSPQAVFRVGGAILILAVLAALALQRIEIPGVPIVRGKPAD